MNEQKLQLEFYDGCGGIEILRCIQCGTCSGSCPLADQMDHAPRALFAMIRDTEVEAALRSNTPWFCVSCYQCMVRCPQNIPVTDLMYALKQMAIRFGLSCKTQKMSDLYEAFSAEVKRTGKMAKVWLMVRYGIKHPFDMAKKAGLAAKLMIRKRLDFFPRKIAEPQSIRFLVPGSRERKKQR